MEIVCVLHYSYRTSDIAMILVVLVLNDEDGSRFAILACSAVPYDGNRSQQRLYLQLGIPYDGDCSRYLLVALTISHDDNSLLVYYCCCWLLSIADLLLEGRRRASIPL